ALDVEQRGVVGARRVDDRAAQVGIEPEPARLEPRAQKAHDRIEDHSSAFRSERTKSAAARIPCSWAVFTSAVPTTTPSALPFKAAACSGFEIPKPTATGTGEIARRSARRCSRSAGSEARAPVTPV